MPTRRSCRSCRSHVPGRSACGISRSMASACGDSLPCGIWLFANWVRDAGAPPCGSKIGTPYALKSPFRAAAVGNRHQSRAAHGAARAFVVAEEEPTILRDWPAGRSAKLILLGLRQEPPGQRVRRELRERDCVAWNLSLLEELERAAVQRRWCRTWSAPRPRPAVACPNSAS